MPEGRSLINLGELSKPADTLIKKVSGAIGTVFEPRQIRRVAAAKANAALIEAQSQIEITDLHRRAMVRWIQEEAQNQANIESITAGALPLLEHESDPDQLSDDWLRSFFDKSRLVSDGKLQHLWSRILAGEVNQPGEFSPRTLAIVSMMSAEDAVRFQALLTLAWEIDGKTSLVVHGLSDPLFAKLGVTGASVRYLDSLGLIHYRDGVQTGFVRSDCPEVTKARYFDREVVLRFNKPGQKLHLGMLTLAEPGKQLLKISEATPSAEYFDYCLVNWERSNLLQGTLVMERPAAEGSILRGEPG